MFLVPGITGHVGGAAAKHLLKMGKQVRALGRDQTRAYAWIAEGVEQIKGEWEDQRGVGRSKGSGKIPQQ